jgi:hypothetical protein
VYDALFLGLSSSDFSLAQRALDMLKPRGAGFNPTPLDVSLPAAEALAMLHTAMEQHYASDAHSQFLQVLVRHVPSVRQLTPTQLLPVVQHAAAVDAVVAKRCRGSAPPSYALTSGGGTSLSKLDELPAVQQIPSDALPGLLCAAMASSDSYSVQLQETSHQLSSVPCCSLSVPSARHSQA